MRPVTGIVPLKSDFDVTGFPIEDATITAEFKDGTVVTVHNATCRAIVEEGKVVVRFSGLADEETAKIIEALPQP